MGDFLLDLRPRSKRSLARASLDLRFDKNLRVTTADEEAFGLVLTYAGEAALWAPYTDDDGSIYAVAGMAAFEDREWSEAATVPAPGGLAAKALCRRYGQGGPKALEEVNGNRVVFVYHAPHQLLHLVADCAGAFPAFECETDGGWVFGSHPDVLARAADVQHRLDEVSLAEFLLCSRVTPPFTYYQRVRAVAHGTSLTFHIPSREISRRRYFAFEYRGDEQVSEKALAGKLAEAIRRSVRRRTLPRLGLSAVALSGGLDSRALMACVDNRENTFAFCCYNEPNRELRIAESIARALGVRFLPLRRDFEYYGDNAERGVRISGGMGTFANNHFLGVVDRLHAEGMQNLLTGCYFDYLFKGLPLNRRSHWLSGREELAPFRHEFYFGHRLPAKAVPSEVRDRWESRVPPTLRRQDSPDAVFQVEARRTFPLCYEGDNQQRVVPQRITGWYLPVADREVLDVYCRIPFQYKLNRSLFLKTVQALWQRPNPGAFDFFRRVLGSENVSYDVRAYQGDRLFLFISLLTLKLWFDQRAG